MKRQEELKTLRAKSDKELTKMLDENYKELAKKKFGISFRKLKNVKSIKSNRASIARIWTVLKEKESVKGK